MKILMPSYTPFKDSHKLLSCLVRFNIILKQLPNYFDIGPERCIDELIPMLTELIDKIDCNPELMLNLAEQLGKLTEYLGEDENSVHLLKPLELILSSDDSVVREKAVSSLKIVGEKISQEMVYSEYMPLVKKIRKGDLFSMRISACFLYTFIYKRLDNERK